MKQHKLGLAKTRGLTLIEIMIVVSIIAMITAGIAVAAFGSFSDAKLRHANTDARALRQVVQSYWMLEGTSACPTIPDLQHAHVLDEGTATQDPWGGDWKIECEESRITVSSKGPDGRWDTEDDISVPQKTE